MKQLDVVEQHGILLFRAGDKGKESNIHVFRLSELDGDNSTVVFDEEDELDEEHQDVTAAHEKYSNLANKVPAVRNRSNVKDRKLDRSRGCHLYSLSKPGGSHIKMVIRIVLITHVRVESFVD